MPPLRAAVSVCKTILGPYWLIVWLKVELSSPQQGNPILYRFVRVTLICHQNHSRVMPFLLPPPEFKSHELTDHGLTGTCELQICRSAGPWSLGTLGRVEHSIQNAYLKGLPVVLYPLRLFMFHPCGSDTIVGTLRIHREPILYHVVSLFFHCFFFFSRLTSVIPSRHGC